MFLSLFNVESISAKGPGNGGKPGGETAGNNLSFPVIWSEGVAKALPGTPDMVPSLEGEWWYQWGTNGEDPNIVPASCPHDPDEINPSLNPESLPLCNDGVPNQVIHDDEHIAGKIAADNPMPLAKAYIQKDYNNIWQAGHQDWSGAQVDVDWIDWGDNLESVDWYTRSQVRIEVVLFKDLSSPMTEYEMRHVSGWGIDEVHGLATERNGEVLTNPGNKATVYSPCARLTIQKLLVQDLNELPDLTWQGEDIGWTSDVPGVINTPIYNMAVYEGGDGPGYYSAEINVKGRVIYGYTWNVRNLNDPIDGTAAGYYRITFSLDETCPTVICNTSLGNASILLPLEEEMEIAALSVDTVSTESGGAEAVLDTINNLTYIDVHILEQTGGGRR